VRAKKARLRRARCLVAYWRGAELAVENYLRRECVSADLENAAVLQFFSEWRPEDAIYSAMPQLDPASLGAVVREFERQGLLLREGSADALRDAQVDKVWGPWLPAAGLLHFSSQDVKYSDGPKVRRHLLKLAREHPAPSPVKHYAGARQIELPAPDHGGYLARVLLGRRTWRRFDQRPVSMENLATLLWLTWGVQAWLEVPIGRVALKTSPSGGARHPIEVYVAARRVKGLRPGLYHYATDTHRLEFLRAGATARQISRYVGGQGWFGHAAAAMLMTAVFPRTMWKYQDAGSYRTICIEAGHLGQTFCLVAERLGLAPFCTQALGDSRIERDLRIDGVGESVLYVTGVGTRPRAGWTTEPSGSSWPVSTRGLKHAAEPREP
jgi:SagB-type dehydrogenase family enzyme